MMKRKFLAIFLLSLFSSLSLPEPKLGRFSQVISQREGYIWNIHYAVYVERGFKVFAILPHRADDAFGKSIYAGFLTLLIDDQYLYPLFPDPKDGTEIIEADENHIIVAKSASTPDLDARTFCEIWLGYPYLRFWAEIEPKRNLHIQYVLTGYPWANMTAPSNWILPDGEFKEIKEGYILAPGSKLEKGYVAFHSSEPATYLLFFTHPPLSIFKNEQEIRISFTNSLQPGRKYQLPPIYYAILPSDYKAIKSEVIESLWRSCFSPPEKIETKFGRDSKGAFVQYQAVFKKEKGEFPINPFKFLPIPPTISEIAKPSFTIPSLLGDVGYIEGESARVYLPIPENINSLTVKFPSLQREKQEIVENHLREILRHQNPDGTFSFSRGRPFYDGLTASALVQLYPILPSPLKENVAEAVKKCLDYWWGRLERDEKSGIYWFPEPPPSIPQVDYPEITSTLLYPTAAYAQLVDRKYISQILDKAIQLTKTLPPAYDWTGSAYASPGPNYLHIIVESTVGGYLAYASLYHIFNMVGRKDLADELFARASYAFRAMELYKHRREYREDEIVSEIRWDSFKIKIEIPWDYTMFTWFSFIPLWWLPKEDVYNLWNILERERWWRYYEKSAQRAYDYAHLIAIHRFKKEDWRKYLAEFEDKPFAYDYFDSTPVLAVIAYPWLALPN
jgi:hypothetical protein